MRAEGQLEASDEVHPRTKGFFKNHTFQATAGRYYVADLVSKQFDPFLLLEGPEGKLKLNDDDSGGGLSARIVFHALETGEYRLTATSFRPKATGKFQLTVRESNRQSWLAHATRWAFQLPPAEKQRFRQELEAFFTEKGQALSPDDLGLARKWAEALEITDHVTGADLYRVLGRQAELAQDPKVAEQAALFRGAADRLGLLGKAVELQGQTPSGQPLDLKDYRGKVVYVHFLQGAFPQAPAQIRMLRKTYDAYHEKGFEIISVGTDRDPQAFREFVEREQLPWLAVHDAAPPGKAYGPLTERFGILTPSHGLLVDREGRVQLNSLSAHAVPFFVPAHFEKPPAFAPPPAPPSNPPPFRPPVARAPAAPPRAPGLFEWAGTAFMLAVIALLLTPFALALAVQARQRGYSFPVWLAVGYLSLNPLFPLVVLALLPQRSKQAQRQQELEELQARLATVTPGGRATAAGATPLDARSVGDEETR